MHISSYIPMQQSASWRRLNVTALYGITIRDSFWRKHVTRIPLDLYGLLTKAAGFEMPKCDFGLGIVDDPDVHSACSSPMVPWKTYKQCLHSTGHAVGVICCHLSVNESLGGHAHQILSEKEVKRDALP